MSVRHTETVPADAHDAWLWAPIWYSEAAKAKAHDAFLWGFYDKVRITGAVLPDADDVWLWVQRSRALAADAHDTWL